MDPKQGLFILDTNKKCTKLITDKKKSRRIEKRENKKTLVEIWVTLLVYFALEIPQKFTVLSDFVSLNVSFRELILQFWVFVGVNNVVGSFKFPYFVVSGW